MNKKNTKVIAENRKARHDFFIEDTLEAGIVLSGTEIKSIREGKVNLRDSYALIRKGQVILHGMHISPYEKGNINNKEPLRDRILLLKKSEIARLGGYIQQKGLTIIPISLYLKGKWVKIELGVAKGKRLYDKREDIAKREAQRNIEQEFKNKNV